MLFNVKIYNKAVTDSKYKEHFFILNSFYKENMQVGECTKKMYFIEIE